MASSLYTPQLTAWRDAERDCVVEHGGGVYAVRRHRERVEIGGKVFAVADEKEVAVNGGKVARCVEYRTLPSAEALRLTVTGKGAEKEVAEVVGTDGALRVMECGGSYYAKDGGTWEHVVDVQGEAEAFMLLVSVREEEARIVRVQRLN